MRLTRERAEGVVVGDDFDDVPDVADAAGSPGRFRRALRDHPASLAATVQPAVAGDPESGV